LEKWTKLCLFRRKAPKSKGEREGGTLAKRFWDFAKALHVVAADVETAGETIIITVYEPDPDIWNTDFRSKKA